MLYGYLLLRESTSISIKLRNTTGQNLTKMRVVINRKNLIKEKSNSPSRNGNDENEANWSQGLNVLRSRKAPGGSMQWASEALSYEYWSFRLAY